ncbi:MAG: anaerobic ribonucleoside-triphosphate reductase activating protein [Vulcanimicrobiota bacterium]
MRLGGFIPFSLLDYPGRIAAVIFTSGCNFRCPYCHNPELVSGDASRQGLESSEILNFLSGRTSLLDGVVISGGEPTVHQDLADFTGRVKSMGYLVKLDTNGSNPGCLGFLIKSGLLDYIAMDIKTVPERYPEVVKAPFESESLMKSIRLVRDSPDYEFRTTVVPGLTGLEDLSAIASLLSSEGADRNYVLQGFRPGRCLDSLLNNIKPFSEETLRRFMEGIRHHFGAVSLRYTPGIR